jgi:hypothetical protein
VDVIPPTPFSARIVPSALKTEALERRIHATALSNGLSHDAPQVP